MASGKVSPRQKMINMMYLVLTALLALNISKEVLLSFMYIDQSLAITNGSLSDKVDGQMALFSSSNQENPTKVGPYLKVADEANKMADDFNKYVEDMKHKLISVTDGLDTLNISDLEAKLATASGNEKLAIQNELDSIFDLENVKAKDSYDQCTYILVGDDNDNPARTAFSAWELKSKMNHFKDEISHLFSSLINKKLVNREEATIVSNNLMKLFDTDSMVYLEGNSGKQVKWEVKHFYHIPLVAVHAKLTKVQTDIRTAQADLIKFLYSQVDAATFKFNVLKPAVIPVSNYVTQGDSFRAEIFIAAYDSTNRPEITIGSKIDSSQFAATGVLKMVGASSNVRVDNLGLGNFAERGSSIGTQEKQGIIKFKGPSGDKYFGFDLGYQVAAPSLVVSPTKMNVLYRGLQNPVRVSVPGIPENKLSVTFTNASSSKGANGEFLVTPSSGPKSVVQVTAQMPDGSRKGMGTFEFRVKNVPPPQPFFGGRTISDATIKKPKATAAQGVSARLENFEFEGVRFTVTQFKLVMVINGTPIEKLSRSNRVTGDMSVMLKKARTGQKIWIENIKAKGPDGKVRSLGSLAFKVN